MIKFFLTPKTCPYAMRGIHELIVHRLIIYFPNKKRQPFLLLPLI